MQFEDKIKIWVSLDNQIRLLNDKLRLLREEKNKTSETIMEYVETKKLSNATVKISDGKLKFGAVKQTSPLTFKLVNECLSKYITNKEQVETILKNIKSAREIKYIPDIKRSYEN